MTPVAISERDVSILDLVAFKRVCEFVDALPDHPDLTCHIVARLARPFAPDFHIVDGHFLPAAYGHSWLQRGTTIIDPYPWAATSPLMVTKANFSPWNFFYDARMADRLTEEVARAQEFVREVRIGTLIL